jgi:hypothetical protein
VTHPFHPLRGRELEIVDHRRGEEERVYLEVETGRVERVPIAWTSLGARDPFVVLANGRSLFRTDDLLRLCEVVAELRDGPPGDGIVGAKKSVKRNPPQVSW